METSKGQSPFQKLGARLREFRETRRESVAEVSDAIEIDDDALERIERGEECPSEDVLTLLISHFAIREQDAVELWESAGFVHGSDARLEALQELLPKSTLVLLALDVRTMYSDGAMIVGDKNGVVLSFMQMNTQGQPVPVARVGMSYEHAHKVVQVLELALLRKQYMPSTKLLSSGE